MNYIKEFINYIRLIKQYQKIDLQEKHEVILKAFDKEILNILANKANENLIREWLKNNYSLDYIQWYKHAIAHFISYFKLYK